MTEPPLDRGPRIRLVFELSRDDHPRLFDELVRFPKGTKRVNRLRVLAYDGLLIQAGVLAVAAGGPSGDAGASLLKDIFASGITD